MKECLCKGYRRICADTDHKQNKMSKATHTPENWGWVKSKEIKPVHPKGNQPWIFTGRTDAETEAPILWPPDAKSQVIGKDPDAGKDWRQGKKGKKGVTEDEMVGWHHWFNGHKLGQTLGDGEGQKPGVLQSMGLQRVKHNLVAKQQK